MGGLRKQTVVHHFHAQLPSLSSVAISHGGLINDNGIQKTAPSDFLNAGTSHQLRKTIPQLLSTFLGVLRQVLVPKDLKGGSCHLAGKGVASISRAVLTRLQGEHDLV